MASELETMIDQTRIIETINQLFIGTDDRDWALVKSCFAPSVLFDMSSLGEGDPKQMAPEEIAAAWDAGLKPLKAIHHQAGNYLVRVSGMNARVRKCIALKRVDNRRRNTILQWNATILK